MSKEKFRYSMIYDDIKKDILEDVYAVGSLLPTEQVLSENMMSTAARCEKPCRCWLMKD